MEQSELPLILVEDFIGYQEKLFKRAGDEIALGYYKNPDIKKFEKEVEGRKSIYSDVDIEIQNFLTQQTLDKYPSVGIISEEDSEKILPNCEYIWMIDPLDGTRGYLEGIEHFVLQGALIHVASRMPVAAIVYKPLDLDEERKEHNKRTCLYTVIKDKKRELFAHYNNDDRITTKLNVSDKQSLPKSTMLAGRYGSTQTTMERLEQLPLERIVHLGSSGNKLATIARGDAEAYVRFHDEPPLHEWDTAAGVLMVTEAGGKATDAYGNPLVYLQEDFAHRKGLVISNGKVHDELLKKLEELRTK